MKKKRTAHRRNWIARRPRISVSALFKLRALVSLALVCTTTASVQANIITVTNTNDSGAGSLRQALVDANDGDTITFAVTGSIGLTSGELLVDKSITISGPGSTVLAVNGNATYRVFHIAPGKIVTISDLAVTNGNANKQPVLDGGGVYNDHATLTLTSCTISNNSAFRDGGGIDNAGAGTVTLNSCVIVGNSTGNDGGGICNNGTGGAAIMGINNSTINNNAATHGAGICNDGRMKGTTLLQITNTTLSNNSAGNDAGAILNIADTKGTATLSNCTISGNAAQTYGGGINNVAGLTLSNTTFSGNSANFGGSIANGNATLSIEDTVLNAGKMGVNIYNNGGTIVSHGYNLSSDDGGGYLTGPGDQINTDPGLGPLQDNGGPTFTHALSPGSPGINTGDPGFTPPPLYDQRGPGFDRVVNSRIDIGSFEVQQPLPTPTPTATPCASAGSWTEQAPYPIAVSGHAVISQGGNVYSFGGIVNNAAITNAYRYDPASNSWTPIASLPAPRGWFSGASDGTYIYLLGGVDQNFNTTATLWRYDPVSNTYNTSLPSYTIPTYFHASAYLNGKIYRIAGAAIGTDFHVEVYDIATNTWSMAANYPFANHNLMAVALDNYIYAGGGNASPDKTYRYDPSTNVWDDAAIADLPAGRSSAASGAYNGRWLLAGGDVNFATSNSVIAWDPATNTWDNLPNMLQARDNLEGATAGQSFYAVAGDFGPGNPSTDNQQYTEMPCVTATPTPTASATPTATVTPFATPTPTATATSTSTPTSTPRLTPTPRVAPTPRPRPTPAPRP
jgi:N-acetylneuraminic acid mutarotase